MEKEKIFRKIQSLSEVIETDREEIFKIIKTPKLSDEIVLELLKFEDFDIFNEVVKNIEISEKIKKLAKEQGSYFARKML